MGGAIFNLNGAVTANLATIARNTADQGGGGVFNLAYDSFADRTATVSLVRSIVADSVGPNDVASDRPAATAAGPNHASTSATVAAAGNLVESQAAMGTGAITGSPLTADPKLAPALAANGAPTRPQTLALDPTSPAVDAAGATCPTPLDQRNFPRPAGAGCDLGAYEAGSSVRPTISDIANLTVDEDVSTGDIAFTVGDAETPAANLTLAKSSSNATLVPVANIVFGGSGANRTVRVTPAANQSGTATIRVTVSDAGLSAFDEFVLTVNPVNDLPTVSAIAGQSTFSNVATGDIAFTVGDVETAAGALGVSATSSNTALVPNAGIVTAGKGASRSLRATPAAGALGTTTITVLVTDAGGLVASTSFTLTVVADTTPVACAITFVGGTPKRVEVTVTDAGSGLAAIEVTSAKNIVQPVTVSPSSWAVGTTGPVVITATKIDQSSPAQVAYVLTDRSGNRSSCT